MQIHDHHLQRVGGIPALAFLVATRITPGRVSDVREEDSSVVLLRVLDQAALPDADEALRVRVENAQRVSGELDRSWDHREVMDPTTHHLLSYAGVRCRVLGTFYISNMNDGEGADDYRLMFGSDLSNYYPNRGLKVFKPRADRLGQIVNYRDPRIHASAGPVAMVHVGQVRYASTNRPFQQVSSVPVQLTPTDLLGQKTALFGMTRSGKSNTTKIVLQSIFALRWTQQPGLRIGQIVFDPNGEYANENTQDTDHGLAPNAIKNVWACAPTTRKTALHGAESWIEQCDFQIESLAQKFGACLVFGFEAFADGSAGLGMAELDPPFLPAQEFRGHGLCSEDGVAKFLPEVATPRFRAHAARKTGHTPHSGRLAGCGFSVEQIAEPEALPKNWK